MSRRPFSNGGTDGRATIQIAGLSPAVMDAFRVIAKRHNVTVSALGRKVVSRVLAANGFDPETGKVRT